MTDEERSKIAGMIDKYGPDQFMKSYINQHPRQADRIQQVIGENGIQDAVRMLFNYQPQPEAGGRVPGSAVPTNPRATGVGMPAREAMGVGAAPSTEPGPRRGVTEALSRQLPSSLPQATTGLEPRMAPISDLGSAAGAAQAPGLPPEPTHDVYAMFDRVAQMSKEAGVPMPLLMGMIKQESQFDPAAVSGVGARGLIQMMPDTARDRGLHVSAQQDERLTPLRNLEAGLSHMKWLKDNYAPGNVQSWLAAYNAGHTRLRNDAWKRMKEPREYANKVSSYAKAYSADPALMAKDFLMLFNNMKEVR